MDRDAGGTCYVLSGGMRGKADDSSVVQSEKLYIDGSIVMLI